MRCLRPGVMCLFIARSELYRHDPHLQTSHFASSRTPQASGLENGVEEIMRLLVRKRTCDASLAGGKGAMKMVILTLAPAPHAAWDFAGYGICIIDEWWSVMMVEQVRSDLLTTFVHWEYGYSEYKCYEKRYDVRNVIHNDMSRLKVLGVNCGGCVRS